MKTIKNEDAGFFEFLKSGNPEELYLEMKKPEFKFKRFRRHINVSGAGNKGASLEYIRYYKKFPNMVPRRARWERTDFKFVFVSA